jgi:hypothetical protein
VPLLCVGDQNIKPTYFDALAAQLRIIELFTPNFMARHGGVVISELEYMGATTIAPINPNPVMYPGNPSLSRIMEALTSDFRRWIADRDYRKCDVLGISSFGDYAELLEVTTTGRLTAGERQIQQKLDILRNTVNEVYAASLNVDWQPSMWLPNPGNPSEMYYPLLPSRRGELRYLCYEPTYRICVSPGVVLYEVHVLKKQEVPVPVPVPKEVKERLPQDYRERFQLAPNNEAWARQEVVNLPDLAPFLTALAVTAGVAMAVVCVATIIDPVPGDEVATCSAAMALLKASNASP